jgi:hypothetical protein
MRLLLILFINLLCESEAKSQIKFQFSVFTFSEEKNLIKTTLTNASNRSQTISQNRIIDYVNGATVPIGTYIVELQKWQDGFFKTVPITADINPAYFGEQLDTLKTGESISDTLEIPSRHYNSSAQQRFAKGKYRIRIAFNQNGKRDKKSEFTEWQEFDND